MYCDMAFSGEFSWPSEFKAIAALRCRPLGKKCEHIVRTLCGKITLKWLMFISEKWHRGCGFFWKLASAGWNMPSSTAPIRKKIAKFWKSIYRYIIKKKAQPKYSKKHCTKNTTCIKWTIRATRRHFSRCRKWRKACQNIDSRWFLQ